MKTETEKYIREQIPTMVGEHHVSAMKLTTLIGLLQGYAQQSTLSESKAIAEIVGDKLSKEDRMIPEHYVLATLEWLKELLNQKR